MPFRPHNLRRSLRLVTVGAGLCMVFLTGTTCPLLTEYFLSLGATDWHFGLLAGLPNAVLGFQLLGAYWANHLHSRKPLFMTSMICGRLMVLPVIVLPVVWHPANASDLILTMVLCLVSGAALMHIGGPLWFAWMADLVPRRILSRYWGVRQLWMQFSWAFSFLAVTAFSYLSTLPVSQAFAVVASLAVAAGVMDILLFIWVEEPPNTLHTGARLLDVLLEPFRHRVYRTYVWFWAMWMASLLCGAAFMQVYALKVLQLTVWQATLIWCVLGVSTALASPGWGRLADRHGHRPVLLICIACKPWVALVFALLTPATAVWVLPLVFLVDGVWNAGMMVGSNGYMLKLSPQRNRSMFIATIIALSGLTAGVASMLSGRMLDVLGGATWTFWGRAWGGYNLVFFISFLMRLACVAFAHRIQEPRTSAPGAVLNEIIGVGPLRFVRFPVGLYRKRMTPEEP
jgi:MFS family permease